MPTHRNSESERYRGPGKWLQYALARGLLTVLCRIPVIGAYGLGRASGWLAWVIMKRRRATVRGNLEIVNAWMEAKRAETGDRRLGGELRAEGGDRRLGGAQRAEGGDRKTEGSADQNARLPYSRPRSSPGAQVREVFQRSGANLLGGFTFTRMPSARAARHIRIEGLESLKAALAEGRGAIILLAHMGPWEALAQLPGLARTHDIAAPFGAMYRPLNNRYLDHWYRSRREARGTRLFSRNDGFHKPVAFLRGGGILGILADQRLNRGEVVPFFGRPAKTSPIPGLLQRRSGAPVLAVAMQTEGRAVWRIAIRPVEWSGAVARERQAECAAVNRVLEVSLAQSVEDGFWFHRRF